MTDERSFSADAIRALVMQALEDLKGQNLVELDVSALTTVTQFMVLASGSSRRHVKALADKVVEQAREQGLRPLGVEGEEGTGWILVDFGDVVVHVMSQEMRDFYQLEKLWSMSPSGGGAPST